MAEFAFEGVAGQAGVAVVQPLESRSAFTRRSTSGASENVTTSALRPDSTARLCSPDAPNEVLNPTPDPAWVFWKSGMISS